MKKQPNRWLVFSSLFFQIAIIMYIFIKIGKYIDSKLRINQDFYSLSFSAGGVIIILFLISNQTKIDQKSLLEGSRGPLDALGGQDRKI